MKNIFKIAGCVSIMAVALSACTKEDDITPQDDSTTFDGKWNVVEYSKKYNTSTTYVATIDYVTASRVTINKLYSLTKGTVASFNGNNLTIQPQIIDGASISGTGVRENSNRISFKYYVVFGTNDTDTVSSVFTR